MGRCASRIFQDNGAKEERLLISSHGLLYVLITVILADVPHLFLIMAKLGHISTSIHTLSWKGTTEMSQSQAPNEGTTRRWKNYRSHIYALFMPIAILIVTCAIGYLGPDFAGTSCTQALQLIQTRTDYEPWPVSQLLAINIGFGAMAFSTAKLVDVLWDVVVGRGGQVLLTYVAYRVFAKSLARAMEGSQVSYHTFAALAFEPGTVFGVFMLVKDFASNRSLRSKMIVSWVLIATLYIIAFPTLSSAMTGYTSVMGAYLEDQTQNLVPWKLYRGIIWIIEDADRIDPYFMKQTPVFSTVGDKFAQGAFDYVHTYNLTGSPERNVNSTFHMGNHSYPVGPPLLNMTRHMNSYIYQNDTRIIYDTPWVSKHLSCQPTGTTYQWGFSFLLTFIVSVLTTVWSIGMYAMWMDTHENSRVDRSGREVGGMFRSVMDLATVIREDLGEAADQCSNSELGKRLKRSKGGVTLPSDELHLSRKEERRQRRKMETGTGLL